MVRDRHTVNKGALVRHMVSAGTLVLAWYAAAISAELTMKACAAVQVGKSAAAVTQGNVDEAFVRGEAKLTGTIERAASALVHVRLQSDFACNGNTSVKVRQCVLTLPIGLFEVRGGRWYEKYAPGYYFGRFLFGVEDELGSGGMNTNYSVVDGVRLGATFEKARTQAHVAVLADETDFDDISTMVRVSAEPVEALTLGLAGLVHTVVPHGAERVDRLGATAEYRFTDRVTVYGEYGITRLDSVQGHQWALLGMQAPAWKILDRVLVELEYAHNRNGVDTRADFAWMLIMRRKVLGVTFDLNVGADPATLGSRDAGDVGGILRTTLKF